LQIWRDLQSAFAIVTSILAVGWDDDFVWLSRGALSVCEVLLSRVVTAGNQCGLEHDVGQRTPPTADAYGAINLGAVAKRNYSYKELFVDTVMFSARSFKHEKPIDIHDGC